jgi:hypothetical protein
MEIMTSLMANPSLPLRHTILQSKFSTSLFPQKENQNQQKASVLNLTSLVDWILFNAQQFPSRIAVAGNPALTYSQLEQDAKQLASFICARTKAEARVGTTPLPPFLFYSIFQNKTWPRKNTPIFCWTSLPPPLPSSLSFC